MIVGIFLILVTLGLVIALFITNNDTAQLQFMAAPKNCPPGQVRDQNNKCMTATISGRGRVVSVTNASVCTTAGQNFDGVKCVGKPSKLVCAARNLDFDGTNCIPKAGVVKPVAQPAQKPSPAQLACTNTGTWDPTSKTCISGNGCPVGQIMYSDKKCRGPGSVVPPGVQAVTLGDGTTSVGQISVQAQAQIVNKKTPSISANIVVHKNCEPGTRHDPNSPPNNPQCVNACKANQIYNKILSTCDERPATN